MNAGLALVRAYLKVNGYLVLEEFPVVAPDGLGGFRTITDLDVLAVRFPSVRIGVPDVEGRIERPLDPDAALAVPEGMVDVVIGEVKEGRAQLNRAIRSPESLRVALHRVGLCEPREIEEAVRALAGQARIRFDGSEPVRQIRLVAFGAGTSRVVPTHYVVSLRDAATWLRDAVESAHEALLPASLADPVVSLLHLANKLR